ncbi:pyrimidine-nucleoside phosphorylase [Melghiribacillus thermohalophilus]|uniref:Pyrimidine-nucleoside phosphorylase n=1 Tax=Melghiribacillus thermohalophilus TaxID=1324956 RepID=A0A4R3NAH1_9BACI|nr:pyrimidine-nucleoside phosphorylase [Melghiribacillus thermohalophilus]TCT25644.1 pyrimidine-nucleoside phosphorylase [Melghiribacillus thermohalophilus]
MRMYDIIEKKRDGYSLTKKEIDFFVQGYTEGLIPDYQASALCMAIYFQGMTEEERVYLTMAMAHSGDVIDLSRIEGVKVDKHSTGGVGDTTTLVLAPLVASVGVPFAKMSGRGLGHTGGTIDKLESIPGFSVEVDQDEFVRLVNENKLAVVGQSGNLTPADKKLYSLRDVTATISSIPLIASSIMSKKLAAGADAIVLDVKTGSGAFMKTKEEAVKLARAMVSIGKGAGRETIAVISDMNQPLGRAIGNALEVKEAIDTLQGKGPEDLTELSLVLGSHMVVLAGKASTPEEGKKKLQENIENGKALEVFRKFVQAQGGDPRVTEDQSLLPEAKYQLPYMAKKSGYIAEITADEIGTSAMLLGAGRTTKESAIDLSVGIVLHKKVGEFVQKGERILTIHANQKEVQEVEAKLDESIRIQTEQPEIPVLIYDIVY